MNNMSSLEAAAEAAAKVNAMLIAKGKLKPPPSAVNQCKGSNVKSAGDLFTAEVEINDAPLSARNLLTRGHTQDEINKYSGAAVSTRGRYMTYEEKAKNTGERPLYLYVQASEKHAVDLGVQRIQEIIQQHLQQQQNDQPQTQHQSPQQQMPQQQPPPQQSRRNSKFHKFVPRSSNDVQQGNRPPPLMSIQTSMPSVEKVPVGLDHAEPVYDLRNKVVGNGGTYLHFIRSETGAIVTLRGKGSGYIEPSTGTESPEPMYLCIEHHKFEALQRAKYFAQDLVKTIQKEYAQWQQQQQQLSTMQTMQNSEVHGTQYQTMTIEESGLITFTTHEPLQTEEMLKLPDMVTSPLGLRDFSSMPILSGQIQQQVSFANPQLPNLQQHPQSVQHQVQQQQQHQMGLPPHIQTGPPPPHALMATQQQHHQQQLQAMGVPQLHHLKIHHQQQTQPGMGGGIAFPPQMQQTILSPLQTMSQPQQQACQPMPSQHQGPPPPAMMTQHQMASITQMAQQTMSQPQQQACQPMPSQHQGPPPPAMMTQHQMASITQMAQQTMQGTLLVSPGQMVFTQAPVSSPHHQSPQPQHPQQHHQSHQQVQQQQLPPQAQMHHQQPMPQTPTPNSLPPTNQQPPSNMQQQQQHIPAFQQMYIPQQLQQQGAGAGGMAVPPLHAAMMHPPPIGLSPHPQPVPMPNMTNQPQQSLQMNNGMQQGFMGIPSNQSMQSNNSVPMGAYPYQQFSPAGNGPAGGVPGTGGATLPAVSYPIYRQEQRPPPPSGNMSTDQQQNPGGQQQIIGGKTGSHKKRFTEDADHPDDGFQQGGMPVMNPMGQPPPPPPSHSPNHHQPPPRQGNGLQEMLVGSTGPSSLVPPSLQQQHGNNSGQHHQLQQHHPQHHHHQQQQDRDKQLMPPPPPPPPSGEKRPGGQNEPDVKRHQGALSSVSGYGSDEEDQNNGDESQQRQQRNQQQHGNGSSPSYSTSGGTTNFMPPKPTFTHYSSKPQMYGHHQGAPPPPLPSQTTPQSTQAQSPPNTSMMVTSTVSNMTSTSPHNFQSLPCPPPQPPPPIQQHQMPGGGIYNSNPPPSQLPTSQPSPSLPPPFYTNQGGQQHQPGVTFTGYQYNSSLPFWMAQQ